MKNAVILHGMGCAPDSFWYPSIKSFLEKNGYSVWVPDLPDRDVPDLNKWLPFVLSNTVFNEETILIGHSAGGPLILSILETITVTIHKAVLVAGYAKPCGPDEPTTMLVKNEYNWTKIKSNVKDLIFINSNNDPWKRDHKEGIYMFEKLGGTLILLDGEGHMGSNSYNQPYKEHKLLEKLLDLKYTRTVIAEK